VKILDDAGEVKLAMCLAWLEEIDPVKLEVMAKWWDVFDDYRDEVFGIKNGREVQEDFRAWAGKLRVVVTTMKDVLGG
jgi:hypothetical protein